MTMRPLRLKCSSCISTLQKVEVPTKAQKHIIKKHYSKTKHGRQSMFFKKYISPQDLFGKVIDILRSGIRGKKQGLRYIYYYTFAFKVGLFRTGVFSELTKTVKIVCQHTECRKCRRHWPRKVVTIYPYKNLLI